MHRIHQVCFVVFLVLTGGALAQLPPPQPPRAPLREMPAPPDPPGLIARFGATYFRHEGNITTVAFSADSKRLVVFTQNSRMVVWNVTTAKKIREVSILNGLPLRVAFSKDGKEIIGLGYDASTRAWSADSGAEIRPAGTLGQRRYYHANVLGWAPEKNRVLACDPTGTLRLIDCEEKTELRSWKGHPRQAMAVALSPDGKLGASIAQENRPILWDVAEGKEARALEPSPLRRNLVSTSTLVFSPDGKYLVQGSYDRTVVVWDTSTGKIARRLEVPPNVNSAFSVAFSPDGKYLAGRMTDRTIRLWGLASGLELRSFDASGNHHEPLAFSADSRLLAAGHGTAVRLWDIRAARELFPTEGHTGAVSGMIFLDGGKLLASCASDGTLRIWDIAKRKEIAQTAAQASFLNPLAPAGGTRAFELFGFRRSMILNVADGRLVTEEMRQFNPSGAIRGVSSGGKWLVMSVGPSIALLDAKTGRQTYGLTTTGGYLRLLQFSPDDRLVAVWMDRVGTGSYGLRIWQTASGRELPQRLPENIRTAPVRSLAFSRDGRLLAILDYNNMLHVIESATGAVRNSFATPAESPLATMTFNRDGNTLFLGLSNGQILARDLIHGAQAGPFRAHGAAIQVFALTDDGKLLATGGSDSTIMLCSTKDITPRRPETAAAATSEISQWWDDLGSTAGPRVTLALWRLQHQGDAAVALVRERFRADAPAPQPPSEDQIAKWIADLDNDRFAVRERAHRALANAGDAVLPALQSTLDRKPSDEVRRRLMTLRNALAGPLPPAKLRPHRVLELLDRIGSPAARDLLAEFARTAADADVRAEALRIIERLQRVH